MTALIMRCSARGKVPNNVLNKTEKSTTNFWAYLKNMGPGIIVVLTWLGAGDLVEAATAGGNYGYTLMWSFALALFIRYLFVSIITKYQLFNPRRESVIAGLTRIHPLFAPFIFICGLLISHGVGVYLLMGISEVSVNLSGIGDVRWWSVLLSLAAFLSIFKPIYRRTEKVILFLAGLLSFSLIALAMTARPSLEGLLKGLAGFAIPAKIGRFDAIFIAVSMLGAVGGGLANLMYPYFIREKGWADPKYRRMQRYDLILGIVVLVVLDLAVWTIGAEILYPKGIHVTDLNSLAQLLGQSFGVWGARVFYLGIFAALFSSMAGNGAAYGYLISDSFLLMRKRQTANKRDISYRWIAAWVTLSPLPWVLFGRSDFIGVTIAVNAAQVVVIPLLVLGIWLITARSAFIGREKRNKWWENLFIAFMLLLACGAAYLSLERLIELI